MIEPNWDLFLWALLIMKLLAAIASIILGITGTQRAIRFSGGDAVIGCVDILIVIIILTL